MLLVAVAAVAISAGVGLLSPTAAHAATYGEVAGEVACNMTMDQNNRIYERHVYPHTPSMYAPKPMTVSWQPILFRYANGAWQREVTGPILKGQFNGLYSVLPNSAGFNIYAHPAYWRVAVYYRWYWNGAVVKTDYQWAGTHEQTFVRTFPDGSFQSWLGDSGDYCLIS